jgi:hypothetical protein
MQTARNQSVVGTSQTKSSHRVSRRGRLVTATAIAQVNDLLEFTHVHHTHGIAVGLAKSMLEEISAHHTWSIFTGDVVEGSTFCFLFPSAYHYSIAAVWSVSQR